MKEVQSLDTPLMADIRRTMRAVRARQGVSQAELSRRMERMDNFIAKIETGSRRLDLVEFVLACNALGLDPRDVLTEILDSPSAQGPQGAGR